MHNNIQTIIPQIVPPISQNSANHNVAQSTPPLIHSSPTSQIIFNQSHSFNSGEHNPSFPFQQNSNLNSNQNQKNIHKRKRRSIDQNPSGFDIKIPKKNKSRSDLHLVKEPHLNIPDSKKYFNKYNFHFTLKPTLQFPNPSVFLSQIARSRYWNKKHKNSTGSDIVKSIDLFPEKPFKSKKHKNKSQKKRKSEKKKLGFANSIIPSSKKSNFLNLAASTNHSIKKNIQPFSQLMQHQFNNSSKPLPYSASSTYNTPTNNPPSFQNYLGNPASSQFLNFEMNSMGNNALNLPTYPGTQLPCNNNFKRPSMDFATFSSLYNTIYSGYSQNNQASNEIQNKNKP